MCLFGLLLSRLPLSCVFGSINGAPHRAAAAGEDGRTETPVSYLTLAARRD